MDKYITLDEFRGMMIKRLTDFPFVSTEYEGLQLPPGVDDVVRDLKTFEVRDDDCWIVTYPKAGTTWTQEIMSCVMHDGNLEEVNTRYTMFRVPYLEQSFPEPIRRTKNLPPNHIIAAEIPSPRVIKSHLPGPLLPLQLWEKKAKIVYVIRNPKDLAVSFFYFIKMVDRQKTKQPFGEFLEELVAGKVIYGPWWEHFLYFWKRRHDPNILLLRFEDMKMDLRGNVEKISQFLGKNLSAEKLDAITEHCTFANMKSNPMVNPDLLFATSAQSTGLFMRKGKVGDWRSHFTVAQNEAFDTFIKEKLLDSGLTFEYEY